MKKYVALILTGMLLLNSFALAENSEWKKYYLPAERYPPIVFDDELYEEISGPPGGAMIQIEGTVYAEEKFAMHKGWYLKTKSGEKWAVSLLSKEDEHQVDGKMITVYGSYTGIAPMHVNHPDYGFMPSMEVIRYVLNGEIVTPPMVERAYYTDAMREEFAGKYRYEVYEGKTLEEIKELLGGLMLYHENKH